MRNFQEIWDKWEETHDDKYRDMAFDLMKPKISHDINNVKNIPKSALEAEYAKATYKAFEDYNPKKGSFKTYLFHHLKSTNRYIYQNYDLYMPEAKAQKMNTFNMAYKKLSDKLGREPSAIELADDLGWSLGEVGTFLKQHNKSTYNLENASYLSGSNEDIEYIVDMVYHSSTPEEQNILEYIFGMHGKPALETNQQIAAKTGIPLYKVKKLRAKLFEEIRKEIS